MKNGYLVLLRGVNVGGKNKVSMPELKQHLEDLGCSNVHTYINSGNILIQSEIETSKLSRQIEQILTKDFKIGNAEARALVIPVSQLDSIVRKAPKGFGGQPNKYHSDVIFLIGINSSEAMKVFSPRDGVDKVWQGDGVIYSQRVSELRTKSRLNKIISTPAYKSMTIRSWSTVTKLLRIIEEINTA